MQIYLDNSATTKICDEALEVYIRVSKYEYGNPSSLHSLGVSAEGEIDKARAEILRSLSMKSGKVVFTASGTEANNLAIIGRATSKERYRRGAKVIISRGEHASVSEPAKILKSIGIEVVEISTRDGVFDLEELKRELDDRCILVSVMLANNETGAVYDIPSIARLIKAKTSECLLHLDATQGYLKIPFTKAGVGADLITVSSHKIEGPKGVGALIFDESIVKARALSPIILGGGQEDGFRSGTENVPGIAAFGEAVRIGYREMPTRVKYLDGLREYLIDKIRTTDELSEVSITLPPMHAPHILNITLPSIKSETALHYLSSRGIYVSSGSACSSNTSHKSGALIAYGRSEGEADSSLRISLSHRNTREEIDLLVDALCDAVCTLARIKR